jgi:hypothetical protein
LVWIKRFHIIGVERSTWLSYNIERKKGTGSNNVKQIIPKGVLISLISIQDSDETVNESNKQDQQMAHYVMESLNNEIAVLTV